MKLYGLTGGTGSGKSAAARHFAKLGLPVIDADAVGHEIIAPGGAAAAQVLAAFGTEIALDGTIDRERLAARVFGNPTALEQLNAIVHPAIFAEIGARCAQFAEEGAPAVILDAALIGEGGAREPWLAGLIVVTAPAAERKRRLVKFRNMDPDDVDRRMAAQSDPQLKADIADWVIDNTGDLSAMHRQVEAIAEAIDGKDTPA